MSQLLMSGYGVTPRVISSHSRIPYDHWNRAEKSCFWTVKMVQKNTLEGLLGPTKIFSGSFWRPLVHANTWYLIRLSPHLIWTCRCSCQDFQVPSTWLVIGLSCLLTSNTLWCKCLATDQNLQPSQLNLHPAWTKRNWFVELVCLWQRGLTWKLVVRNADSVRIVFSKRITYMQFLAAKSRCTNFWEERYSIPRATWKANETRSRTIIWNKMKLLNVAFCHRNESCEFFLLWVYQFVDCCINCQRGQEQIHLRKWTHLAVGVGHIILQVAIGHEWENNHGHVIPCKTDAQESYKKTLLDMTAEERKLTIKQKRDPFLSLPKMCLCLKSFISKPSVRNDSTNSG